MSRSIPTRRGVLAGGIGLAALALAGCGEDAKGPVAKDGITEITVGATPEPHAKILGFVQDNLAQKAGLRIKVQQYTDYQIPNQALSDGDIDANYFQHKPFLEEQIAAKHFELTPFAGVHIEPLGLYSKKVQKVDAIPEGAEVAIPNDPTNRGRALALLSTAGLITIKSGVEPTSAKTSDVEGNPKKLTFTELDAAQIPRSLGDFSAAVINGNYAIQGGLKPSQDALVLEKGEGNPYANMLVVRTKDKNNAALKKLDELLHTDQVRQYITTTFTDGSVIPAF